MKRLDLVAIGLLVIGVAAYSGNWFLENRIPPRIDPASAPTIVFRANDSSTAPVVLDETHFVVGEKYLAEAPPAPPPTHFTSEKPPFANLYFTDSKGRVILARIPPSGTVPLPVELP